MSEKGMYVIYQQFPEEQHLNTVGIYDLVALPQKAYTRIVAYRDVHYKSEGQNLSSYKPGEIQHLNTENRRKFMQDTARRLFDQNPKVTFVVADWREFKRALPYAGYEKMTDLDRQVFTRQGVLDPYDPALDDEEFTGPSPAKKAPARLCPVRW